MFSSAGWSKRCRVLAQLLPAHTLRHDFNLFVGAMAPRVLEAGVEPAALRRALENAWLLDRVQRRWQHLVLSLGETATADLLERAVHAAGAQPIGVRIVQHAPEQATEGWSLPLPGHNPPPARGRGVVVLRASRGLILAAPQAGRPETVGPARLQTL